MAESGSASREHLLHLDASACEMDLFRDAEGLVLEREPYVTGEREQERIPSLRGLLDRLRETQLPFCDYTWLVPEVDRPAGHERFAEDVDELVQTYLETASQLRFTM